MNTTNDICRLDYLIGTLATAYKGTITSLVAKDFCMSENAEVTTFRGTVLSLPEGEYEASLNRVGVELSRVRLQKGLFEFTADRGRIAAALDLQIDIIQTGRHIGTFLLKKEAGVSYISVVELSEELAGMDLTRLTHPLRGKIGLLQKAEKLVSQLLSSKKDWAELSETLNGFSFDVFWSAPEVFYGAYGILAHFTLLAAERSGAAGSGKPVSDYIDLLGLPLTNEQDVARLRAVAQAWIQELSRSRIDLSPQAHRVAAALRVLHGILPDLEIRDVLLRLIESLKKKNASIMRFNMTTFSSLVPAEDAEVLSRFGRPGRRRMLQDLTEAEQWLEKKDHVHALDLLADIDSDISDEQKAVSILFDVMERNLSTASTDAFAGAISFYLADAERLSDRALQIVIREIPGIMDRLLVIGRAEVYGILLNRIAEAGTPLKEELMLDPRIARSVLNSGQSRLIAQYSDHVKQITIPSAKVRGLSSDTWAELVDPLHLDRLTRFMDLLMSGHEQLEGVLVHVIANLAIGGVLIPDDKLFQRRITAYLNSGAMKGRFLLNFLLLERLPVYFNEVGATSRIRDYSTQIDSWGNDPVIYFLRKQIHVNASGRNVSLIEHVLKAWSRNEPAVLKDVVPPDVYSQVKLDLIKRYYSVINPFFTAAGALRYGQFHL